MKIEIDLKNVFTDEETINESLSRTIISRIKAEIIAEYKDKIDAQIADQVKVFVDNRIKAEIETILDNVSKDEPITLNRRSHDSISDYVKWQIETTTGYETISNQLKKLADNHFKKLKVGYDLAFASHIVSKIKDAGMLNNDAVKSLIQ